MGIMDQIYGYAKRLIGTIRDEEVDLTVYEDYQNLRIVGRLSCCGCPTRIRR